MSVQILTGDSRKLLLTLPDGCVQCCVTSPPYWGLRDYAHSAQVGREPSPNQYVSGLVGIFRQVRRILKPNGTLWLNVGDGYARNGGTGNCGPNAIASGARNRYLKRNGYAKGAAPSTAR